MSLLESASAQDIKRLLELFPVSSLKTEWEEHKKDNKAEVCFAAATAKDIKRITKFISDHLSCCRQHVYIFSHALPIGKLPNIDFSGGEKISQSVSSGRVQRLYLIKLRYNVVLRNPLEESSLEFIWPFSLEFQADYLIVRFVTLEKNIVTYFEGRPAYVDSRSADEKSILQDIFTAIGTTLSPTDLHKGVKHLWSDGFMDSPKTHYKKSISTASEAMDEERGIKEFYPELYDLVKDSLLLNALFIVSPRDDHFSVSAFSMEPSKGCINFPRYSDRSGDTDYVVNEILRHN
jgi:hypothetical protein